MSAANMTKNKKTLWTILAGGLCLLFAAAWIVCGVKASNTSDFRAQPPKDVLLRAALAREGEILAAVERDGDSYVLRGYDKRSGDAVWEAPLPASVTELKSDGEAIFLGAGTNLRIYRAADGALLSEAEFDYPVLGIDVDREGGALAVSTSLSSMKNLLYAFDLGGDYGLTERYEAESSRRPNSVALLPGGRLVYSTLNSVFEVLPLGGDYTSKRLIEPGSDFDGMIAAGDKLYLSTADGGIEVWADDGKAFVLQKKLKGLTRAGMGASNGGGLAAFADNTGRAVLIDTAADEVYAKFDTFTSSDSLSLDGEGNVCSVKRGSGIRYFDYAKLPSYTLSKSLLPYAAALTAVSAAAAAVLLLLAFPKTARKTKEIASKIFRSRKSYLFLLPTFGLLAVFSYFPIVWGMSLGFYDYMPGIRSDFVGWDNFVRVFHNPMFWQGVGNMVLFLVTDLLKAFIPPFIIAQVILAIRNKHVRYWSRFVMFLPGVLPGIAMILLWTTGILGPGGVVNQLLHGLGITNDVSWAWLGHASTAKWALIFIGFPFVGSYLIYYGALHSISPSYYDAAKIDGCGWLKRMFLIDIPMISPQLKYIFVVSFIGSVQDFGRVFLTTRGAFDTNIPALELYLNISQYQNFGEAAAMGLIMFVAIFGITLMNLRIRTHSEAGEN